MQEEAPTPIAMASFCASPALNITLGGEDSPVAKIQKAFVTFSKGNEKQASVL